MEPKHWSLSLIYRWTTLPL